MLSLTAVSQVIACIAMAEGRFAAEAKYLQGQGVARQRQAIVNGLRESVLTFERDVKDISSRDVVELMMMTQ